MIRRLRASARTAGFVGWTVVLFPAGLASLAILPFSRVHATRWGAGAAQLWAQGSCRIFGVRFEVRGQPPQQGSFAACNHISWLDILVLGSIYRTNFIAKSEIANWPVFGVLARLGGTLWVDRKRMRDTARLKEELRVFLDHQVTITMFPEGWSGDGAQIRTFHPPLFATPVELQVPCVPITVTYRTPGDGPGEAGPDAGSPHVKVCWWDETPLVKHFMRLVSIPRIDAIVSFGEPVVGIEDRKALAQELQKRAEGMFEPVPRRLSA